MKTALTVILTLITSVAVIAAIASVFKINYEYKNRYIEIKIKSQKKAVRPFNFYLKGFFVLPECY
jgi:uncharacterized protein YxeA